MIIEIENKYEFMSEYIQEEKLYTESRRYFFKILRIKKYYLLVEVALWIKLAR